MIVPTSICNALVDAFFEFGCSTFSKSKGHYRAWLGTFFNERSDTL